MRWTPDRKPFTKRPAKTLDWIYSHIDYRGEGCLLWPYTTDGNNRPLFVLQRRHYKAHRVMCEIVNGPAPEDKPEAAHNCGNGHLACVHPLHLEWKSHRENHADKERHGTNQGSINGCRTRLLPEAIADIQQKRLTQPEYAAKYGLSIGGVAYWQRTKRGAFPLSMNPATAKKRKFPRAHDPFVSETTFD